MPILPIWRFKKPQALGHAFLIAWWWWEGEVNGTGSLATSKLVWFDVVLFWFSLRIWLDWWLLVGKEWVVTVHSEEDMPRKWREWSQSDTGCLSFSGVMKKISSEVLVATLGNSVSSAVDLMVFRMAAITLWYFFCFELVHLLAGYSCSLFFGDLAWSLKTSRCGSWLLGFARTQNGCATAGYSSLSRLLYIMCSLQSGAANGKRSEDFYSLFA